MRTINHNYNVVW